MEGTAAWVILQTQGAQKLTKAEAIARGAAAEEDALAIGSGGGATGGEELLLTCRAYTTMRDTQGVEARRSKGVIEITESRLVLG